MKDNKRNSKPLSARAIDAMRPGDPDKSDAGEYMGLGVSCGPAGTKTFIYRFNSPETGKLTQLKIGNYLKVSPAEARVRFSGGIYAVPSRGSVTSYGLPEPVVVTVLHVFPKWNEIEKGRHGCLPGLRR